MSEFKIQLKGWQAIVVVLVLIGVVVVRLVSLNDMRSDKDLMKHIDTLLMNEYSPYVAEKLRTAYDKDPTGKTDPFKSFIAEQEPVEERKRRKPKTYLETLDLSQMDLIAIIISPKGNWAMVRDAKGLGYVIKKGTPIGTNEGVVQEIREKEVIVREQYRDYRGRVETRDVAKKLLSQ